MDGEISTTLKEYATQIVANASVSPGESLTPSLGPTVDPPTTNTEHADGAPAVASVTDPDESKTKRKRRSGGSFCAMGGCSNRGSRDKVSLHEGRGFLRYYRLPTDKTHRRAWMSGMNRASGGLWKPSVFTRVCSDHFHDVDFNVRDVARYRALEDPLKRVVIRLKPGTVPNTDRGTGSRWDPFARGRPNRRAEWRERTGEEEELPGLSFYSPLPEGSASTSQRNLAEHGEQSGPSRMDPANDQKLPHHRGLTMLSENVHFMPRKSRKNMINFLHHQKLRMAPHNIFNDEVQTLTLNKRISLSLSYFKYYSSYYLYPRPLFLNQALGMNRDVQSRT